MAVNEIKLCKDCKHFDKSDAKWGEPYWCSHPQLYMKSPITGETIAKGDYWSRACGKVRSDDGICGTDGCLHEPRAKPWWRFW